MPQSGDRNITSTEASEKIPLPGQREEKSLWYVIISTIHLERYFTVIWPVFSLIQMKLLKKNEVSLPVTRKKKINMQRETVVEVFSKPVLYLT